MVESKKSLHDTMVFDSRDWGARSKDAWVYGIVVGWDRESLVELSRRFNWTYTTISELDRLHREFVNEK